MGAQLPRLPPGWRRVWTPPDFQSLGHWPVWRTEDGGLEDPAPLGSAVNQALKAVEKLEWMLKTSRVEAKGTVREAVMMMGSK